MVYIIIFILLWVIWWLLHKATNGELNYIEPAAKANQNEPFKNTLLALNHEYGCDNLYRFEIYHENCFRCRELRSFREKLIKPVVYNERKDK